MANLHKRFRTGRNPVSGSFGLALVLGLYLVSQSLVDDLGPGSAPSTNVAYWSHGEPLTARL